MNVQFSSRPMNMREVLYRQRWEQYGDWESLIMLLSSRSNLSPQDMMTMTEDDLYHLMNLFDESMQVYSSIRMLNRNWERPKVQPAPKTELTAFEQLIKAALKGDKL